jgi:hypothetical protein
METFLTKTGVDLSDKLFETKPARLETVRTVAIDEQNHPIVDRFLYSHEIVIGNRRFASAWYMGTESEIDRARAEIIAGIEAGVEVRMR